MRITDAFRGEHGVFYAQFSHIEQDLDLRDARAVRTSAGLVASALAPHAHLENELLFDVVRELNGGDEPMPFRVMRQEHDDIEAQLEAVQSAFNVERAADLLLNALVDARQHFLKEEEVAFALAEQLLSEAKLIELGGLWAERRGVKLLQAV